MSKVSRVFVAAGVAALAFTANVAAAGAQALDPGLCDPGQHFSLTIDNPFSPMRAGDVSVLVGTEEGQPAAQRISVLNETLNMYSGRNRVTTRVVEEASWTDTNQDGVLDSGEPVTEVSRNYFAQTDAGTVCYFGEDVKIYENGAFHGDKSGSWRADKKGNSPGIFMPANPMKGDTFFMEGAPGVARDQVTVVGFKNKNGYHNAMHVEECNTLDNPVECDTKYYASGVGLIVDEDLTLTP